MHDTWRYNRAVMFTLKPAPTGTINLAVERNRVKSATSSAPVEKFYVDRFVYYDAYLGKMMECNPYANPPLNRGCGQRYRYRNLDGVKA
ncbi:hypothetical protein N5V81_13355 [Escherichia coli]|nr:hypothetical protein [Escherichia coli]